MFKKLDKLILKAFVWPFIATFFITLFVFMMQILWKYIDDLVGKGLDVVTLCRFIAYASATLVTLALPISILLSSIMTFGKLGESFELVAIKSSGISLLRFMQPIFFVSLFLTGIAFLFANNIVPVANLKFAVIYNDIYRKSPAFDLKDGVFYNGFRGYTIKVGKKENDKSTLQNVLIYEQSYGVQDNTIISEKGKMTVTADKKFLEFKLQNGHSYEEKGSVNSYQNEFIALGFKEYNKLFDLTQLNIQKTSDSLFMNNIRMKTLRQLNRDLDSLKKIPDSLIKRNKSDFTIYFPAAKFIDSLPRQQLSVAAKEEAIADTIYKKNTSAFDAIIPDTLDQMVTDQALTTVSNLRNVLQVTGNDYTNRLKDIVYSRIEWHKKLSLSFACMVLFFIGAPLGSIIRKGGVGLPLVVALLFFMIFYLLNIFGEKFTKDNILDPITGIWLPVIVLTPVGFFLTYKAMHDSQLFNKEFYYRTIKNVKKIFGRLFKFSPSEESISPK